MLDRILGGILSMLVVVLILHTVFTNMQDRNNIFELRNKNGLISNTNVNYENKTLHMENDNAYIDTLTFRNKSNHSVTITESNIKITCQGENKEDKELVQESLKIKAMFSKEETGEKSSLLTIPKGEMIYIYINSYYNNTIYPQKEVSCKYSINLSAS